MRKIKIPIFSQILDAWWIIVPLLLTAAIMIPRLLSPHFNFEDDGKSLQIASQLIAGKFDSILVDFTGRFRPLYWLGFVPLYLIGGKDPFWYFLSNTLLFAAITACLIYLVRMNGGTKFQAGLTGVLFTLSGPAIESFYTVSKPEPAQLLWLLVSLVLGMGIFRRKRRQKVIVFLLMVLVILAAFLIKETTLVIVPISIGWLVLISLFNRRQMPAIYPAAFYAAASLTAGVIFTLLETHFLGSLTGHGYGGHYTLTLGFMFFMSFAWAGWLICDFLGAAFCLLLLIVVYPQIQKTIERGLLLAAAVWMAGWIVVFLPWDRTLEYYLLPFAVGSSLFCGVILGEALSILKKTGTVKKTIAAALLAGTGLFTLITLFNNYSNARVQLVMDQQEARLMNFLTLHTTDQDLILANFDANSTFFSLGRILMETAGGRPNINLQPFQFETAEPGITPQISYYLVTAEVKNRPLFVVRSQAENTKENGALSGILGPSNRAVFVTQQSFRLLTFNLVNLVCPLVKTGYIQDLYCHFHIPVIDTRLYTYGWQVYRVENSVTHDALPAVFHDGTWKIQMEDGNVKTLQFGRPGDRALSGDWTSSGTTGIGLFDPATLTWSLDNNLDGQADTTFQLRGMVATDIPLTGDWNCAGKDTPGFFRPSDGSWHFWTSNYSGPEDLPILKGTESGVIPLVGDWNGDGCDTVGIYRPAKGEVNLENTLTADLAGTDFYAPKNDIPVAGDWGGTGVETLAFFLDGSWTRLFANCGCVQDNPAQLIQFGQAGDQPLAGKWLQGK